MGHREILVLLVLLSTWGIIQGPREKIELIKNVVRTLTHTNREVKCLPF